MNKYFFAVLFYIFSCSLSADEGEDFLKFWQDAVDGGVDSRSVAASMDLTHWALAAANPEISFAFENLEVEDYFAFSDDASLAVINDRLKLVENSIARARSEVPMSALWTDTELEYFYIGGQLLLIPEPEIEQWVSVGAYKGVEPVENYQYCRWPFCKRNPPVEPDPNNEKLGVNAELQSD